MLRKALLAVTLALGFLVPALAWGGKEGHSLNYYAGGFYVYGHASGEEGTFLGRYTGGFFVYRFGYTGGFFV